MGSCKVDLKEYIEIVQIPPYKLSKLMRIGPSTLYGIMERTRHPTERIARIIVTFTKRRVGFEDLGFDKDMNWTAFTKNELKNNLSIDENIIDNTLSPYSLDTSTEVREDFLQSS